VLSAAVDDGECQVDGLDLDVGAEGIALRNAVFVAIHFDLRLVGSEKKAVQFTLTSLNKRH